MAKSLGRYLQGIKEAKREGSVVQLQTNQEARQASNLSHYAAPLLPLLEQTNTLDVVSNGEGKLWVNRLGRGFACEGAFSPGTTKILLNGIATVRQIQFDHEHNSRNHLSPHG